MGVKLTELIQKKDIGYDDLKGKKIAVDFNNFAYQFLSSIRQRDGTPLMDSKSRITSHLMGIWTRFSNLMIKGVKLVVVFEGKAPSLKIAEIEEREHRKRLAEERFIAAQEREDIDDMYKYGKRVSRLTFDMVNESKELIKAMGLPVIQAPSEADAQMAFMNERNDVWACASSDYDCLLHGTPRLITNLTLSQRRKLPSGGYIKINPEMIELKDVLNNLSVTQDQLIAIGILVGTDYNIGGVKKIGPKTALKLVKQYRDFDKLFKEVKADFNWKKIYAIFKSMPIMKNYQLKWNPVDADKVKEILVKEHDFSEERIDKNLNELIKDKSKGQTGLGKWV